MFGKGKNVNFATEATKLEAELNTESQIQGLAIEDALSLFTLASDGLQKVVDSTNAKIDEINGHLAHISAQQTALVETRNKAANVKSKIDNLLS